MIDRLNTDSFHRHTLSTDGFVRFWKYRGTYWKYWVNANRIPCFLPTVTYSLESIFFIWNRKTLVNCGGYTWRNRYWTWTKYAKQIPPLRLCRRRQFDDEHLSVATHKILTMKNGVFQNYSQHTPFHENLCPPGGGGGCIRKD